MSKRVVFRGMEHSPVIEAHINQQLAKIDDFLAKERGPSDINLSIEHHEVHAYNKVSINIRTAFNSAAHEHSVHVHKEGDDLYRVIDDAIDTAYQELHEKKQEIVDNLRKEPKLGELYAEQEAKASDESED
jgi:ribosome-associated translation inhibitor RaiA